MGTVTELRRVYIHGRAFSLDLHHTAYFTSCQYNSLINDTHINAQCTHQMIFLYFQPIYGHFNKFVGRKIETTLQGFT